MYIFGRMCKGGDMINKIHRATRTEIKDFDTYEEALEWGDEVETIIIQDAWLVTVYMEDVDGFRKGMILEPVKFQCERENNKLSIITQKRYCVDVTSFVSEIHAIQIAKQLAGR